MVGSKKDTVSAFNELYQLRHGKPPPQPTFVEDPRSDRPWLAHYRVDGHLVTGRGSRKTEAKRDACAQLLRLLEARRQPPPARPAPAQANRTVSPKTSGARTVQTVPSPSASRTPSVQHAFHRMLQDLELTPRQMPRVRPGQRRL